ncbi:MAG: trypsin-like peptidase domain-containing protein [Oscillospiraceae bacterium]|nr:trypsin-like peptidase domain-containing protein [Oscillospiraceae bacterium]
MRTKQKISTAELLAEIALGINLLFVIFPVFLHAGFRLWLLTTAATGLLTWLFVRSKCRKVLFFFLTLGCSLLCLSLGIALSRSLVLCGIIGIIAAVLILLCGKENLRPQVFVVVVCVLALLVQIYFVLDYFSAYRAYTSNEYYYLPVAIERMLSATLSELSMLAIVTAQLLCLIAVSMTVTDRKKIVPTMTEEAKRQALLAKDRWLCVCGSDNPAYTSTCSCGRSKREVLLSQRTEEAASEPAPQQIREKAPNEQQEDGLHCSRCGKGLMADSNFCQFCGAEVQLPKLCSRCGAELLDDALFCSHCGTPVQQEEAPPETPAPRAAAAIKGPVNTRRLLAFLLPAALVILLLTLILVMLLSGPGESEEPLITSASAAAEQVLYLELYDHLDNNLGSGSGFLIEDGTKLVTNYHVIDNVHHIKVYDADGTFISDVSQVLTYNKTADLAVLMPENTGDILPLSLADSDQVRQGDKIYAVGYPLGLSNTLSDGIVSSMYRDSGIDTLQITAPVSHGSSGGALLNEECRVVGVVSAYYEDGQNMNIAVASNELTELLQRGKREILLEELYLQSHPQLAYEDYTVELRTLWLPTQEAAEKVLSEWYLDNMDLASTLSFLRSYQGVDGAEYLKEPEYVTPGIWSEEFDAWCFDPCRTLGDLEIFSVEDGYHICCFAGVTENVPQPTDAKNEPEEAPAQTPPTQQEETPAPAVPSETGTEGAAQAAQTDTQPAADVQPDAQETAEVQPDITEQAEAMSVTAQDLQGTWAAPVPGGTYGESIFLTFNGSSFYWERYGDDPKLCKCSGTFTIDGSTIYFTANQYTEDGKTVESGWTGSPVETIVEWSQNKMVLSSGLVFYFRG